MEGLALLNSDFKTTLLYMRTKLQDVRGKEAMPKLRKTKRNGS